MTLKELDNIERVLARGGVVTDEQTFRLLAEVRRLRLEKLPRSTNGASECEPHGCWNCPTCARI